MSQVTITVFTPTYNRATLLTALYGSLLLQDDHDFIWLIVDDGSTDDTASVVSSFMREGKLQIKYVRQSNQGKYIAHNTGVKNCDTYLFVCVDSDDKLRKDAISKTKRYWEAVGHVPRICGIVSPKKMTNSSELMKNPPPFSSLMNLYNRKEHSGETMLVYRTDILRQYLFPEVPGEKFMSEIVIYYQIDKKYKLAVQNEFLYEAEYRPDGLTLNIEKLHWKNPHSMFICYSIAAACQSSFIKAAKSYGCALAWRRIHKITSPFIMKPSVWVILAGTFLQIHYMRIFKEQQKNNGDR